MKILVTGGTGFIASELVPFLARLHEVSTIDRYVTSRLVDYANVDEYFCNITDYFQVRETIKATRPDVIYHLAGLTAVSHSFDRPIEYMQTDFGGTINLAECALRECPELRAFVFASTSETYGTHEQVLTEETKQYPTSPYAVFKVASEEYLRFLFRAYQFPSIIARPFNTYGRKKDRHFFVEKLLSQMSAGQSQVRLGDPDVMRDFMYVSDHVNAYVSILEALIHGQKIQGDTFQFCTAKSYYLKEVVEMAKEVTGYKGEVVWNTLPKRPDDARILHGSYDRAKKVLGWEPKVPLKDGLRLTLESWK